MAPNSISKSPIPLALDAWFQTEAGQMMLSQQRQQIDRHLGHTKGLIALQCGFTNHFLLSEMSRVRHHINLLPEQAEFSINQRPSWALLKGELSVMPFSENSVDLILLHHCLEFSHHADQIIKDVVRALKPQGDLLIALFNRHSLLGFSFYLDRCLKRNHKGAGQNIPAYQAIGFRQLRSWLEEENCYPVAVGKGFYCWPTQNQSHLGKQEAGNRWLSKVGFWGNGYYLVQARKFVAGPTGVLKIKRRFPLSSLGRPARSNSH